MTAAGAVADDAGACTITSARLGWVLASEAATTFDATVHVDVELYGPTLPCGTQVTGSVAWIDAETALALAAPQADLSTDVWVASRAREPRRPST